MSQPLLVLAALDAQHRITACERGAVRIVWGGATLQIRREELLAAADVLACWCAKPDAMLEDSAWLTLEPDAGGSVQMWLGGYALRLPLSDTLLLSLLITRAAAALQAPPSSVWERAVYYAPTPQGGAFN
jgi:hypothetical protein